MNDFELPGMWSGSDFLDGADYRTVTKSDYGTMPIAEFVEAVFCTNDRNASRDVLAEVIDAERKRGNFFRDALADERGCPPSPVEVACQEGDPCPFDYGDGPDYAACWDEVERGQR